MRAHALVTVALGLLVPACGARLAPDPCSDVASCRAILARTPERYESRAAAGFISHTISVMLRTAAGRRALLDVLRAGPRPARDAVAAEIAYDVSSDSASTWLPRHDAMDRVPAIDALLAGYVREPSDGVRSALVSCGDVRAIPAMRAALRSTDSRMSHDAYAALSALDAPDAVAALATAPARLREWAGNLGCPRRVARAQRGDAPLRQPWVRIADESSLAEVLDMAGPCFAAVGEYQLVHARDGTCFVGTNRGEWGGWLEADDTVRHRNEWLGFSHPMAFIDRGPDVLMLSGICHGYCTGSVHTLRRGLDGRWAEVAVASLPGAPTAYGMDQRGRLLLRIRVGGIEGCPTASQHESRIAVRVESDGALTLIE